MEFYGDTGGNWGRHYSESLNREVERKITERDAFRLASLLHTELCSKGGFTAGHSGVGPVSAPDTGYMVSDGRSEMRVRTCTVETIYRFLLTHWDRVSESDFLYFGGWQTDDYVYLDVSSWHAQSSLALYVARERKQIAIYDLANKVSITI